MPDTKKINGRSIDDIAKVNTIPVPSGLTVLTALNFNGTASITLDNTKEYVTSPENSTTWKYNSTVEGWVPSVFATASILQDASGNDCKIDVPAGNTHSTIVSAGWVNSKSAGSPAISTTDAGEADGYITVDAIWTQYNYNKLVFSGVTGSSTTQILILAWMKNIDTADSFTTWPHTDGVSTWGASRGIRAMNVHGLEYGVAAPEDLLPGDDRPGNKSISGSYKVGTGTGQSNQPAGGGATGNYMFGPGWTATTAELGDVNSGDVERTSISNSDPFVYPQMFWLATTPLAEHPTGDTGTIFAWVGSDLTHVGKLPYGTDGKYSLGDETGCTSGNCKDWFPDDIRGGTVTIMCWEGREYQINKLIVLEA